MRLSIGTSLGLVLASLLLQASPAAAQDAEPPRDTPQPPVPPTNTRLNPTGRDIMLSAPLRDGPFILGEVDFVLGADDSLRINARRLLDVLMPRLEPERAQALEARLGALSYVSAEETAAAGYPVRYVPETIGLAIDIPADARTRRQIQLARFTDELNGVFDAPANVAGYINFRTFTDYQWNGSNSGLEAPTSLIDGAIRYRNFVLEGEATLRLDSDARTFVR